MSKQLVLELPDNIFLQLQKLAKNTGQSLEIWAKRQLEYQLSENENKDKKGQVRSHFGAVDLGYPTGANNEEIDADLAKEYIGAHEEK